MKYFVTMNDFTPYPVEVVVHAYNKAHAMEEAEKQYPGWLAMGAMDQEDHDLQLAEDQVAAGERIADEIYCSYFE